MNARRTRVVIDLVALAGGFMTVAAEIISATEKDNPTWSDGGRILGLALFLGAVGVTLDQVMRRLQSMEVAQQESIRSLEVAEMSRYLGAVDRWCGDNPGAVHVQAVRAVADRLLGHYVPDLIDRIERFCGGKSTAIEIEDESPVHDLLESLAKGLPAGGVWLGITLREQMQDWTQREDAFSRFAETIRERTLAGTIQVARIYHFTSDEARARMAPMLAEEQRANVNIRCEGTGKPQDVSILFAPPENQFGRIRPPFGDDLVAQLKAAQYRVLCAVAFHTRDDGVLRGASIYGASHRRTDELVGFYNDRWRRAEPLSLDA